MKALESTQTGSLPVRLSRQAGLSLLEMAVAATLVAGLIMGVLVGVPKLQLEQSLGDARREIPATINAISNAYASQFNTDSISNQVLIAAGVWPSTRTRVETTSTKDAAGKIISTTTTYDVLGNVGGSKEYVFPSGGNTWAPRLRAPSQGFFYWLHNVPAEGCMPLLRLLSAHQNVALILVGESSKATPGPNYTNMNVVTNFQTNGALQLNMGSAATYCSGSSNKSISALIART